MVENTSLHHLFERSSCAATNRKVTGFRSSSLGRENLLEGFITDKYAKTVAIRVLFPLEME